jgi:predicted ester cyclase
MEKKVMQNLRVFALITSLALCRAALPADRVPPADPGSDLLELLRQYRELGVQGQYEKAAAMWAPQAFNNGRTGVRPEMIRTTLEDIYRTFPDYKSETIEVVVNGDTVISLSRVTGTHTGVAQTTFNGGLLKGAKPTQKRFEVLQTHWWKVRDGKIVWHQGVRDDLSMMRQLGLLPDELPKELKVQ